MFGLGLGRLGLNGAKRSGVSNVVDLFIVAGQSNALGIGVAAQSPASPYGLYMYGSSDPIQLVDPLGNVNTGSAWPAFANEWASLKKRRAAFVYTAAVGSSLVAAGTGWNPTGNLRASAVAAANDALAVLSASVTYQLGDLYIVWLQGEQEGQTINGTTITGATYEAALGVLADYFKAQLPALVKIGVIHISGPAGSAGAGATLMTDTHRWYQEIRAAHTRACVANANLESVYDGNYHFVGSGLSKDGTHYSQPGYNLVGKLAARGVAGSLGALPSPSSMFISASSYPRGSHGFDSSRTVSHVTPAGCNFLIIAVSHGWPGSALLAIPSATFGGVAMRRAVFSGGHNMSGPAGSCFASIFYIDEALYGATLAGVTENIVVSTSNNQKDIAICAINARDVSLGDSEGGAFPTPAVGGTDNISASITTFSASSLVVAVAGFVNPTGTTTLSATMSGVTEIMDASLTSGSEALGMVCGYSEQTSRLIDQAISATWSGGADFKALAICSFRPRYQGE